MNKLLHRNCILIHKKTKDITMYDMKIQAQGKNLKNTPRNRSLQSMRKKYNMDIEIHIMGNRHNLYTNGKIINKNF